MKLMRKMMAAGVVLLLAAGLLASCGGRTAPGASGEAGELKVYTSFYTMFDFAKKIGGEEIELINLVPAGSAAHDWEPSPQDIARLEEADVFIYNGAGMEGWVEGVLDMLSNEDLIVVETAQQLPITGDGHEENEHEDEDDGHGAGADPHVWLNPQYAKLQMEAIRDGFSEAAPELTDIFSANFNDVAEELDKLDQDYRNSLADLPGRAILVEHEAFYYLAEAYGLEQIGINSAHGTEPDAKQLARVLDLARDHGIHTVFYEGVEASNITAMLAQDLGGQALRLNPFEGLTEQEMENGEDYFSVMQDNLEALKEALG